jgi:ABC-2 type transport system ATP-binding protein
VNPIISVVRVSKTYPTGFRALEEITLDVMPGEIFALLGPNGAGKTTLIGLVCGTVKLDSGQILVDGHDIRTDYRIARSLIGLVPQELTTDAFETVWATVSFSRGLFGLPAKPAHIERILKTLSLWDKKDSQIRTLSGGMKRRVMIAKALSHEPRVLFLDEPSAGVDVALRKDMWALVHKLRQSGVTIVLTTHYIEEAQEMADRVAFINHGRIILVDDKDRLMHQLGKKELTLELLCPLAGMPPALERHRLVPNADASELTYVYDGLASEDAISQLLADLQQAGIRLKDIHTRQSSLEDIFMDMVRE